MKAGILILLFSASVLMGQNRWDAFTPVAPDDPAMPTLLEWQKKVTDNYNASESYFYEVTLDDKQVVTAAILRSEASK